MASQLGRAPRGHIAGGAKYALDVSDHDLRGTAYRNAARPLLAEEARQLAAAEGLSLMREGKNKSGFKHVHLVKSKEQRKRPYEAWARVGGSEVWIASFATAEEAALCVARHAADPAAVKARMVEEIRQFREARDAREADAAAVREAASAKRQEGERQRQQQRQQEQERKREAALEHERKRAEKRLQAEAEVAARQHLREEKAAQKAAHMAARDRFKEEARRVREATARQHAELAARQQQQLRDAAQRVQQQSGRQATAHDRASSRGMPEATRVPLDLDLEAAPLDEVVAHVLAHRGNARRCLALESAETHEAVRKRFLALALRLHPDKTSHAQARDAFNAVDEASKALLAPAANDI